MGLGSLSPLLASMMLSQAAGLSALQTLSQVASSAQVAPDPRPSTTQTTSVLAKPRPSPVRTAEPQTTLASVVDFGAEIEEESLVLSPSSGADQFALAGRRNYKNATRERRMEANARERTRVHTIGAAFDQLRRLVPSFSTEQKLSKLSILRIACKYILLLASMNDMDYSNDQADYTVQDCIEMLSQTISQEAKIRRP